MLSGSTALETPAVRQQVIEGQISAYARTWTRHVPEDGDAAVILALSFSDSSHTATFLGNLNNGMWPASDEGFSVYSVPGASGFVLHQPISDQPATEFAVTFARENTVFEIVLATISGDIANTDAQSVAALQAAGAPGAVRAPVVPTTTEPTANSSSTPGSANSAAHALVVLALCLLAAIVVVYLMRRHRRTARPVTPIATAPDMLMLASDENRDRVAEQLNLQFITGRLTLDDLNHRLEASLKARTLGDLYTVTRDLPPT